MAFHTVRPNDVVIVALEDDAGKEDLLRSLARDILAVRRYSHVQSVTVIYLDGSIEKIGR